MPVRRTDGSASGASTVAWLLVACALVSLVTLTLSRVLARPRRPNRHSVRRAAEEAARRANRIAAEADDGVRVRVAFTKDHAGAGAGAGAGSASASGSGAAAAATAATNGSRGLGLFNVSAAPLGTCLLAEPPLFTAPSAPAAALRAAWDQLDPLRRREVMAFSDAHAQPGGPKSIFGIMRTNCLPTADVILHSDTNAMDQQKETKGQTHSGAAPASASVSPSVEGQEGEQKGALMTGTGSLFLLTCRANHSCRPNAEYSWSEELGAELLYPCPPALSAEEEAAGRVATVPPNEEITIRSGIHADQFGRVEARRAGQLNFGAPVSLSTVYCLHWLAVGYSLAAARSHASLSVPSPSFFLHLFSYIDSPRLDYAQRRKILSDLFKFSCRCQLCLLHGCDSTVGASRNEARALSDSNRRRIASLDALLPSLRNDPSRAVEVADRLLELLAAEGFAHSSHSARAALEAFYAIEGAAGLEPQALRFAERAARAYADHRGKDSPLAKEARNCAQRAQAALQQAKARTQGKQRTDAVEPSAGDQSPIETTAADRLNADIMATPTSPVFAGERSMQGAEAAEQAQAHPSASLRRRVDRPLAVHE